MTVAATALADPEEPEDPNPYGFPWHSYPDHHETYDARLRVKAAALVVAGSYRWITPCFDSPAQSRRLSPEP